jgi:hypothetical protein
VHCECGERWAEEGGRVLWRVGVLPAGGRAQLVARMGLEDAGGARFAGPLVMDFELENMLISPLRIVSTVGLESVRTSFRYITLSNSITQRA